MSAYTELRMATEIPTSAVTADTVETRVGTLRFFDGLPDEATVQALYDNIDFLRAVQAFLTGLPAASFYAMRSGVRSFGPDNVTVLVTETLLDSHALLLTPNTEAVYNLVWLDTHDGPLVIEIPPGVLGFINDPWQHYVTDVGNAGPDRGQGGKYLLLPPNYTGPIPDCYFVVPSRAFGQLLVFRGFLVDGDPRPAVENTKQHFRVYPLEHASDPPPMTFVDISGQAWSSIAATDASSFDQIAAVVGDEPLDLIDPETRGLLAAIGIRKDRPFAPDARMRQILAEAAAVGNATARTLAFRTRDPDAFYYPDSGWEYGWIGGCDFSPDGVLDVDARVRFFYLAWGITPAMTVKMVGIGSQYAVACHDAAGHYFDGAKTYRLHLPGPIPAKDFWSVITLDPQTRSLLQTDQRFPSISSETEDLAVNSDASVDVYFGPEPPAGRESNWIQTIPGKGWFAVLRLYGPLEPWFDTSWRPGEIELAA